jgi:hypothetical protein
MEEGKNKPSAEQWGQADRAIRKPTRLFGSMGTSISHPSKLQTKKHVSMRF